MFSEQLFASTHQLFSDIKTATAHRLCAPLCSSVSWSSCSCSVLLHDSAALLAYTVAVRANRAYLIYPSYLSCLYTFYNCYLCARSTAKAALFFQLKCLKMRSLCSLQKFLLIRECLERTTVCTHILQYIVQYMVYLHQSMHLSAYHAVWVSAEEMMVRNSNSIVPCEALSSFESYGSNEHWFLSGPLFTSERTKERKKSYEINNIHTEHYIVQ